MQSSTCCDAQVWASHKTLYTCKSILGCFARREAVIVTDCLAWVVCLRHRYIICLCTGACEHILMRHVDASAYGHTNHKHGRNHQSLTSETYLRTRTTCRQERGHEFRQNCKVFCATRRRMITNALRTACESNLGDRAGLSYLQNNTSTLTHAIHDDSDECTCQVHTKPYYTRD